MSSANTVGNEYKGHLTHSSFEDVFFVFTRNYRFYLNCIVPPTVDFKKGNRFTWQQLRQQM